MIKLLTVCPISWDSTSFYRAFGVFPDLRKKINIEAVQFAGSRATWAQLGTFDILFFQRPARGEDVTLAEYCKKIGIKVWVDFDDNLFALPNESRGYFDYNSPVQKTMLNMLLLADVISVSTEELKKFFSEMMVDKEKIEVIPNALNDTWFEMAPEFNKDSNVVLWRGSETHCGDLIYFNEELFEAISASSEEWHFMGYNPFTLTNTIECKDKIKLHAGVDPLIYHQNLKKLRPKVMHVPLVDNQLNKAKSNIAWIEATMAGAVTIAPNWPEWNKPGVITYDTQEDYKNLLMNSSLDYEKCWKDSRDYIEKNLLLSYVNEQRRVIVEKLLKK